MCVLLCMFKRMFSLDTPLFYYLMYCGSWEDMFEVGLDMDVLDGVDERPMFASKKYLWNLPVRNVRK